MAATEQPADATAAPPASDSTGEQVAATEQPADATTTAPATESAAPAGDLAFINASADQVYANWIIGKGVYGPDNQSIGEVSDLVLQKDTGVRVALIDVGGFLGIGEKTVAIPFTDLQFTKVDNSTEPQVTVALSKDQLNSQPAFDTSALDDDVAANAPAPATTDNTTADNAAPGDPMAPADPNAVVATDPMAPATTDQAATPDTTAEITTGSVPPSQDLAASKLIGATVYASDDSNIGEVGDIVFDKQGDIDAIVVDVGGFLGIGEKPIALNFEQLNMRVDQNGTLSLVANASKDQLNNAPAFETTVQ
jgi:sporulation protein YlmC with PRC-barrel domain